MREYKNGERKLHAVVCNGCGRELKVEEGVLKEGCFEGKQLFGYFSSRDGECHSFDLCEECYGKMIRSFRIPVKIEENAELL